MDKKAFTLLELMLGMILLTIVFFALSTIFVAERTQCMLIQRRAEAMEEARVAMDNLEWILRFAVPDGTLDVDAINHRITATIDGGHIGLILNDTQVRYQLTGNALTCTINPNRPDARTFTIANGITSFAPTRNNEDINISLTAGQGDSAIALQTTIRALGEP